MLIVGEKEQESGTVSVRRRGEGDVGTMPPDAFATYFQELADPSKSSQASE
ncbi:MAG: His/Gly/Thr/Pro-type tRNA ligase C-terminal domain-containing protein [Catalinimonas sp.]